MTEKSEAPKQEHNPANKSGKEGMQIPEWFGNAVSGVGSIAASYFFLFKPQEEKLEEVKKQVNELQEELEEVQEENQTLKTTLDKMKEEKMQQEDDEQWIPTKRQHKEQKSRIRLLS